MQTLVSSTSEERKLFGNQSRGISVESMLNQLERDVQTVKHVHSNDVAKDLHIHSASSPNGRRHLRGFETVGSTKVNGYLSMAQFVKSTLMIFSPPSVVSESRRLAESASSLMFATDPNYVMRGIIQNAATGKNTDWITVVQPGQSDDMESSKTRNLREQSHGDANFISSIRVRDITDRISRMLHNISNSMAVNFSYTFSSS